ncbi:MAG: pyrroline-5-carboxylate reductase [Proteobacteria bacterium]|nr:pyrroline-5-carboxylate reductase [Pseudomonadota bacterium]
MAGPLLLVGCGKMGGALLGGWLDRGMTPGDITVIEPGDGLAAGIAARHGVTVHTAPGDLARGFSPAVVLFAVKPQTVDQVAPAYRAFAGAGTVFLTIAAGKTVAGFERHLGETAAVVRAMPNTPAAVRRGIAVAFANANVGDDQRAQCQALLEAVGEVAWVDDERLLDPVTAVSGSGPAYVFLLIECLAEAGIAAGLPEDLSSRLARATVAGAGELARLSEEPAGALRQNVTSPGGTTAAALEVLMGPDGLKPLMVRAVEAATRRSRELAS